MYLSKKAFATWANAIHQLLSNLLESVKLRVYEVYNPSLFAHRFNEYLHGMLAARQVLVL